MESITIRAQHCPKFSRMMTMAFEELSPNKAFIYIDDLIYIGNSFEEHLENLECVFKICEKYNYKLNPNSIFFRILMLRNWYITR